MSSSDRDRKVAPAVGAGTLAPPESHLSETSRRLSRKLVDSINPSLTVAVHEPKPSTSFYYPFMGFPIAQSGSGVVYTLRDTVKLTFAGDVDVGKATRTALASVLCDVSRM